MIRLVFVKTILNMIYYSTHSAQLNESALTLTSKNCLPLVNLHISSDAFHLCKNILVHYVIE